MNYDKTEIMENFPILSRGGNLEIRVIYKNPTKILSGIFDSAEAICKALDVLEPKIKSVSGKEAVDYGMQYKEDELGQLIPTGYPARPMMLKPPHVYWGLNENDLPVTNKLSRGGTVKESNVSRVRWLLVDIDPDRPTDTSSTNRQMLEAFKMAETIYKGIYKAAEDIWHKDKLKLYFPEPLVAESGNGYHLLYPVDDLPEGFSVVAKTFLNTLAEKFNDTENNINVDISVFDLPRICKLYGTKAVKGSDNSLYPHRLSAIIAGREHQGYSDDRVFLNKEKIEKLTEALSLVKNKNKTPINKTIFSLGADTNENANDDNNGDSSDFSDFDYGVGSVDDFDDGITVVTHNPQEDGVEYYKKELLKNLDAHNIEYRHEKKTDGRDYYHISCPWADEHTTTQGEKDSALIVYPDGIQYKCFHAHCVDRNFKTFCDRYDIPYIEPKSSEEEEHEFIIEKKPWEGNSPETLKMAIEGTLLGRMCEILSLSSILDTPLSIEYTLPKALTLIGSELSKPIDGYKQWLEDENQIHDKMGLDLAKNKIATLGGQGFHIWALLISESGSGKDMGGLTSKVARHRGHHIYGSGSAEGLLDAYYDMPNGLMEINELGEFFNPSSWKNGALNSFTDSFQRCWYIQNLSTKGNKKGNNSRFLNYLAPSILANIQPDIFLKYVRTSEAMSGFLPRFLMFRAPPLERIPDSGTPSMLTDEFNEINDILDHYNKLNLYLEPPKGYLAEFKEVFESNGANLSVAGRYINEYGPKLAGILQADGKDITKDTWDRVGAMLIAIYNSAEKQLNSISDDERTQAVENIYARIIKYVSTEKDGYPQSHLVKNISGLNKKNLEEHVGELIFRGQLRREKVGRGKKLFVVEQKTDDRKVKKFKFKDRHDSIKESDQKDYEYDEDCGF